jgi:hypothetical protein
LDQLLQDTSNQALVTSLAPRQLLTSGAFRLCIREIYKNFTSTDVPLEYDQQNADVHWQFSRDEAMDPENLWMRASQLFSS